MKQVYKDLGTFMIRTPSLEVQAYQQMFDERISEDEMKEKMRTFSKENGVFREAILVGSMNLYKTLKAFINNQEIKKLDYFMQSISKYYMRMCMRPTPFGLFSGVAFGKFGEANKLVLDEQPYTKVARPDLEWIMGAIKQIEEQHLEALSYRINDSLFIKGERALLIHSTGRTNEDKIGEISIRCTKAFQKVVQLAREGMAYRAIEEAMFETYPNTPQEKIKGFLKELIEREFLISNLRVTLTVKDQMKELLSQLNKVHIEGEEVDALLRIQEEIEVYNQTKVGEGEEQYLALIAHMKEVVDTKNIVQIDMKANFKENELSHEVIDEVNDLMVMLMKLATAIEPDDPFMTHYKQMFIEKYGQDREIPVLELLDNDLGIGAPMGYERPSNNRQLQGDFTEKINEEVKRFFLEKYFEAVKNNEPIITLSDEDLKQFDLPEVKEEELPQSLDINLILKSNQDGKMQYYIGPNLGATGAGKSFGRFSHMMQEPEALYQEINKTQLKLMSDYGEYVDCEITYLPSEVRNANVTRNLHGSDYEIALFAGSSKDAAHRLKLEDLVIGIDDHKFYVKSKSLDKRLMITINNMLNAQTAPNVIRFLYDVSIDGQKLWYKFVWSKVYKDFTYTPAVRYKNTILTPQIWNLDKKELGLDKEISYAKFKENLASYRVKYSVPDYVYITFADNRIMLNLKDEKCLHILHHECRNNIGEVILNSIEEGEELVQAAHQSHMCEVVVPFVRVSDTHQVKEATTKSFSIPSWDHRRVKFPFDEWLYFKLYGVTDNVNDLIAYELTPYCKALVEKQLIEEFFFMRYIDEEQHVRLRLKSSEEKLLALYPTLKVWMTKLQERGLITYYAIDSYNREIERYGGEELIDVAEQLFFVDSLVVGEILRAVREEQITYSNELIGMISVIHYMESFGIPYAAQVDYLRSQIAPSEYREDFKKHRQLYMKLCNSNDEWKGLREEAAGMYLLSILEMRSSVAKLYSECIRKSGQSELIILDSVIHLHCNRLFGIDRDFETKVRAMASHALYALKHFK